MDVDCVFVTSSTQPHTCNPTLLGILSLKIEGAEPISGFDAAGVVAAVGPNSVGFEVGDRVWGFGGYGGQAEYVSRPAAVLAKLPAKRSGHPDPIDMETIGTVPTVGITMVGALRRAGAPWDPSDNKTVIITAGNGGTG